MTSSVKVLQHPPQRKNFKENGANRTPRRQVAREKVKRVREFTRRTQKVVGVLFDSGSLSLLKKFFSAKKDEEEREWAPGRKSTPLLQESQT